MTHCKLRNFTRDESFVLVNSRWPVTYSPLRLYILSTFHCHCLHDFRGSIMNEWCMCIFFHRTRADWFITSVLLLHMYGRYVHSIFWIIMNLYQLNHVISNMFAKHIHCSAFFVAPSLLSTRSKSNYHFKC